MQQSKLHNVEILGGYSSAERRELVAWFYHELPRLIRARGYSVFGRITARLYGTFRSKTARYYLSWFVPLWLHRPLVVVNPDAFWDSVRGRFHRGL